MKVIILQHPNIYELIYGYSPDLIPFYLEESGTINWMIRL